MGRIKFGIKDCKYAPITSVSEAGVVTYGEVVPLPGAVNISLQATGETIEEYADDGVWYTESINGGYDGTLELIEVPESFTTDILGQIKEEASGVVFESDKDVTKEFALFGQLTYKGDTAMNGKRVWFYRVSATRPEIASSTKTNTITPQHDTLTLKIRPRINDGLVKSTITSNETGYATFATKPYEKTGS